MDIEMRVNSKSKDDRRNQRYYRQMTVDFEYEIPESLEIEHLDALDQHGLEHERFFGESLSKKRRIDHMIAYALRQRDALPSKAIRRQYLNESGVDISGFQAEVFHNSHRIVDEDYVGFSVRFRVNSERPSETPSEEAMLELLDCEALRQRVAEAIEDTIEFLRERCHQLKALKETERLSGWIAGEAQERAEEKVKYDDRLEALKAEFEAKLDALKAEVKQETFQEGRAIADEWEAKHVPECQEHGYTEEATEKALDFWTRFVEEPEGGIGGGGGGGFFPRSQDEDREATVKPEDMGFE